MISAAQAGQASANPADTDRLKFGPKHVYFKIDGHWFGLAFQCSVRACAAYRVGGGGG